MDDFTRADPLYRRAQSLKAHTGDAFEVSGSRQRWAWVLELACLALGIALAAFVWVVS